MGQCVDFAVFYTIPFTREHTSASSIESITRAPSKDIPTLDSHGRSSSNGATSTIFTSNFGKCQSPFWLPYYTRPHFDLLSIEDLKMCLHVWIEDLQR
ncbi:hypothetical protein NC651_013899 [Populus alba x Populus x berolinensis]|nr:hypothetical protein NC651_013899 [Populus alba x Populus x berolinensis]